MPTTTGDGHPISVRAELQINVVPHYAAGQPITVEAHAVRAYADPRRGRHEQVSREPRARLAPRRLQEQSQADATTRDSASGATCTKDSECASFLAALKPTPVAPHLGSACGPSVVSAPTRGAARGLLESLARVFHAADDVAAAWSGPRAAPTHARWSSRGLGTMSLRHALRGPSTPA